jgi:branched-chain amino acid transport system ATP-binding protein
MSNMLEIENLSVGYARKGLALDNVSLSVAPGTIVALLGANGAGKTTLIRAVTGLLDLHNGYVASGRIGFDGTQIVNVAPHRLVRMGMGQVPEGRMVFKQLSVEDNLAVGAAILPRAAVRERMDAVYELFPRLLERRKQAAGWLSGGEQQCWPWAARWWEGPGFCWSMNCHWDSRRSLCRPSTNSWSLWARPWAHRC